MFITKEGNSFLTGSELKQNKTTIKDLNKMNKKTSKKQIITNDMRAITGNLVIDKSNKILLHSDSKNENITIHDLHPSHAFNAYDKYVRAMEEVEGIVSNEKPIDLFHNMSEEELVSNIMDGMAAQKTLEARAFNVNKKIKEKELEIAAIEYELKQSKEFISKFSITE